jgi:ABC-type multidrug transport system ATPase subunit
MLVLSESLNYYSFLSLIKITFFYFSYGLLGASGCGKTTVLSCIVGRRKLSSGRIVVFGGVPGDRRTGVPGSKVGYMPQVSVSFLPI